MVRQSTSLSVSLNTALATTQTIVYSEWKTGRIEIPSDATATTLTFYTSHDAVTFVLAVDVATSGVLTVSAGTGGQSYQIPSGLEGARFLKIVANAAVTVEVTLKN